MTRLLLAIFSCVLLLTLAKAQDRSPRPGEARVVHVLTVDGVINPVASRYLTRGMEQAEADPQAEAVIVVLSTPGGLLDATRDIVKKMLIASVPVAVFVYPPGTHAASAGTFITLAGHIAAMAPNTNLGAAHPVQLQGEMESSSMEDKVVNDAVSFIRNIARARGRNVEWAEAAVRKSVTATAEQAVEKNVVDLIANNVQDLVVKMHGRKVKLPVEERTLDTKRAQLKDVSMNFADQLLNVIAHPNIAYILLILGIYGLIYEFASAGVGIGAVVGTTCLLLGLFAMQVLPINWAGLFLIVAGLVFLVLEALLGTGGLLAVGGVGSLIFGSFMLFDASVAPYYRLHWGIVLGTAAVSAAFAFGVVRAIWRVMRTKSIVGYDVLRESTATALQDFYQGEGFVMVEGERWRARAKANVKKGERVVVKGKDGPLLLVEKKEV